MIGRPISARRGARAACASPVLHRANVRRRKAANGNGQLVGTVSVATWIFRLLPSLKLTYIAPENQWLKDIMASLFGQSL